MPTPHTPRTAKFNIPVGKHLTGGPHTPALGKSLFPSLNRRCMQLQSKGGPAQLGWSLERAPHPQASYTHIQGQSRGRRVPGRREAAYIQEPHLRQLPTAAPGHAGRTLLGQPFHRMLFILRMRKLRSRGDQACVKSMARPRPECRCLLPDGLFSQADTYIHIFISTFGV